MTLIKKISTLITYPGIFSVFHFYLNLSWCVMSTCARVVRFSFIEVIYPAILAMMNSFQAVSVLTLSQFVAKSDLSAAELFGQHNAYSHSCCNIRKEKKTPAN